MPSLIDLPTEVRQQILLLTLPDTLRLDSPWPIQFISLFTINQRIRLDMEPVIETWSPLHYISSPSSIAKPKPLPLQLSGRTLFPKIDRICLDLFHESNADRIRWTCYCGDQSTWTHPELIRAWSEAVPLLPAGLREIWLDVTPAPAAKRAQHRLFVNQFVHEKCASRKFLDGHVVDVAALIRKLAKHQSQATVFGLLGRLSVRSEFFVERLRTETERDLEFEGTWVSTEDAQFASISTAVQRMTSSRQDWQGKKRGDTHRLEWLQSRVWDSKTGFTFALLADEGLEVAALEDIKAIAEFAVEQSSGEVRLAPTKSLRRAFQHKVAADLGLGSAGEGEGDDRHVVVQR